MLEEDFAQFDEEEEPQSPEEIFTTEVVDKIPLRKRKNEPAEKKGKKQPSRAKKTRGKKAATVDIPSESPLSESPSPPESPPVPVVPDETSKEEPKTPRANKKRKVASNPEAEPGLADGAAAKKTKNEAIIEQFMIDTLPALRKNMKKAKIDHVAFKIQNHGNYFKSNSGFLATFILPLFHFLGKEEIICSRVSDFDGKKFVKTEAGFHHASFIINHALDLKDDERDYLMRKYGKEYFKIPSKDYVKAMSACKYGEKGEFKVILTGLYEDSFLNDKAEEIITINPVLRYDPVRPKPEKKKKEKKEKKEDEVKGEPVEDEVMDAAPQ